MPGHNPASTLEVKPKVASITKEPANVERKAVENFRQELDMNSSQIDNSIEGHHNDRIRMEDL